MSKQSEIIQIRTYDNAGLGISVFDRHSHKSRIVLICFPAMGVNASYYAPFAAALAEQGLTVVTADLRGHGLSTLRADWKTDFGYREIVSYDFPAVVEAVKGRYKDRDIFLLGHSLGGQLSMLFAGTKPDGIRGLILIAASSPYFRGWPFPKSIGLLVYEQFMYGVSLIVGHLPGQALRFAGREARTLIRDWSRQGLTGKYRPLGDDRDFEDLMSKLTLPVLSISFSDDTYGPEKSVLHLLNKMNQAEISHNLLTPADLAVKKIGHFGWVKLPEKIVPRITDWLSTEYGNEKIMRRK
jgi:predicted alpha/beta hydrolase